MDDKRLEFVAMILAGEEIQYLNPESVRKRVREASAAYDVMMEELAGDRKQTRPASIRRECFYCRHINTRPCDTPCSGCMESEEHPNWEPCNE